MPMTIDYREAFVVDMEMAAHGPTCQQCILAALHSKPENACHKMKYMRDYVKSAFQALPEYYRIRYETALDSALKSNHAALEPYLGR